MNVLMLSRNYPNAVLPHLGLWVEGLVTHLAGRIAVCVVSPVPYAPPLPGGIGSRYTRFRAIPDREVRNGVTVVHPRFLIAPGSRFAALEAAAMLIGIRQMVERLWDEQRFDVIHAHFAYPDGAAAARLARRFGVPLVITEHALWHPWMDRAPRVRRQAVRAIRDCTAFIAASRALRASIVDFAGHQDKARLIPIGMDTRIFHAVGRAPNPDQIVYVGRFQPVKGVDVLLRAFQRCAAHMSNARLILIGGSLYDTHEEQAMHALARALGIADRVEFRGIQPPEEVADLMRRSAFLVCPSRRESFGTVIAEALACGTPVLATRCGGPEDIVTDANGLLVPPDDPDALAAGIDVLHARTHAYDAAALSADAHARYSWDTVADQVIALYENVTQRRVS